MPNAMIGNSDPMNKIEQYLQSWDLQPHEEYRYKWSNHTQTSLTTTIQNLRRSHGPIKIYIIGQSIPESLRS